jgi:hypothetical protein
MVRQSISRQVSDHATAMSEHCIANWSLIDGMCIGPLSDHPWLILRQQLTTSVNVFFVALELMRGIRELMSRFFCSRRLVP